MPSPRAGTVTPDVGKTVREYKAGKVEFRNDKGGVVQAVGWQAQLRRAEAGGKHSSVVGQGGRPEAGGIKGAFIKGVHISATMSPSIRLAV